MNDKRKFLYRPDEYGQLLAKLGRKIQADRRTGVTDEHTQRRHKTIQRIQRMFKTRLKYVEWRKVYEETYESKYDDALGMGKTERQAHKYARTMGENAVLDKFPNVKSSTTVRRAIRKLDDDAYTDAFIEAEGQMYAFLKSDD
ncbi:MAG: hypothetical protein OEX74_12370 [Gammaproteobacteria bacterium]|nr:hypothetical protein [Gammaproteobacteria bacterium]